MAEFKKLSDVNVIESRKEGLNVLVEDNGEIVKLAADELTPEYADLKSDIEALAKEVDKKPEAYIEVGLDVVLPEATIPDKIARLSDYTSYTRDLEVDHVYNVICDGVEYQRSIFWNDSFYGHCIGNPSLGNAGEDTGEPFFINANINMSMTIIYFSTDGPHTISINEGEIEVPHKLDMRLIPDEVATQEDVDKVSEEVANLPEQISKIVDIQDNNALQAGLLVCYTETGKSLTAMFRNTTKRVPVVQRRVSPGFNSQEPAPYVLMKSYAIIDVDGGYGVRMHFGDEYADIIANGVDDSLTLDPDWIAPAEVATQEDIAELSEEKVTLPANNGTPNYGTAGQFAVSDGKGGIMWKTLYEVEEVSY